MSKKVLGVTLALLWLQPFPAEAAPETIQKGDTVVVPLQGEISPSMVTFLRRALKAAEAGQAAAVVFDMNTYGGRLDSAEEITNILNHAKIPTYTFINSNAGSAGVGEAEEGRPYATSRLACAEQPRPPEREMQLRVRPRPKSRTFVICPGEAD